MPCLCIVYAWNTDTGVRAIAVGASSIEYESVHLDRCTLETCNVCFLLLELACRRLLVAPGESWRCPIILSHHLCNCRNNHLDSFKVTLRVGFPIYYSTSDSAVLRWLHRRCT